MSDFSKQLDEVLDSCGTRYIHQSACACVKVKRPKDCDCVPYDTLGEAKAALTGLIIKTIEEELASPNLKDVYSKADSIERAITQLRANYIKQIRTALIKSIKGDE